MFARKVIHLYIMNNTCRIKSPIGTLLLVANASHVTQITVTEEICDVNSAVNPVLVHAAREIEEYFAGRRREFTFPIRPNGTPFQQLVWKELRNIPFGCVVSYSDIAKRIGNPKASRAVGMAQQRNQSGVSSRTLSRRTGAVARHDRQTLHPPRRNRVQVLTESIV